MFYLVLVVVFFCLYPYSSTVYGDSLKILYLDDTPNESNPVNINFGFSSEEEDDDHDDENVSIVLARHEAKRSVSIR